MAEFCLSAFRFGLTGQLEWMHVRDGRVVARASGEPPAGIPQVDCGGRILIPRFVDAHCHFLSSGIDLLSLSLAGATSHEEVLNLIAERHRLLPKGEWLFAVDYDQNRFPDAAHMTRQELDSITAERPIHLRHKNWHGSVLNSAALAATGISASTADPEKGVIGRDASGEPNGLLLEAAHYLAALKTPAPDHEGMVQAILAAGQSMHALGIGAAVDMKTGFLGLRKEVAAYAEAARRGCPVRIRLAIGWGQLFGPRREEYADLLADADPDRISVWGVKLFADGALSSGTAAIYGSYKGQPPAERSGIMNYSPERLRSMVRTATEAGLPVATHAIGDWAVDEVLDAYEQGGALPQSRIEHAMMLSDAQIERLAGLGCTVCFQPEFLSRFDYAKVLGWERTQSLKRFRSVLHAGIPMCFSSDRPIVGGNPLDGIHAAMRRPDGFAQTENLSAEEALNAYTLWAAKASADEARWGSLMAGSAAEFLVLDQAETGTFRLSGDFKEPILLAAR